MSRRRHPASTNHARPLHVQRSREPALSKLCPERSEGKARRRTRFFRRNTVLDGETVPDGGERDEKCDQVAEDFRRPRLLGTPR